MQVFDIQFCQAGQRDMVLPKHGVTAAEIIIIAELHGGKEFVTVTDTRGMDKRSHEGEAARLTHLYGEKVFKTLFPGAAPRLPVDHNDLRAFGFDVPTPAEGAKAAAGRGKPADQGEAASGDAA